jgi:2-dehydropantoate 2-reductase
MIEKIAVFGTGANGSCIAANLIDAGLDVSLIDQWPEHVAAMREGGLRIQMPDDALHVDAGAHHLCDVAAFTEPFDLIIIAVKAYDTRWTAMLAAPHLAEDGLMIGIQNAMTAGDIRGIVGPERTLGCVIELSSEIFTPGLVQRNTPPAKTWMGLGCLDGGPKARLEEVQDILSHVGTVSLSEDILSAKWMKLVVNTMCLGPMAMLGLNQQEAAILPGMRDLAVRIGTEALAAGQTRGHKIEPIFGLKPEDVADTNRLLEKLLDKLFNDIGPNARDCVLQDHLKGRYSEVDQINGLVVQDCEASGIQASANAVIVEITRRIRAGELQPGPDNLQLAREMLG